MAAACAAPVVAQSSELDAVSHLDKARELHQRGERAAAMEHYRAFLGDPAAAAADRATAFNNTCVLLHDMGQGARALDACQKALELRRALGDDRRLSRTHNNLGLVLQSAGRYAEAREAYWNALDSNRARDDAAAAAINLANLGLLASDEGRYGRALERHLEVETLAARHVGEPWAEEQRRVAWINRGVVYEKLGAYDQALELYQLLVAEEEEAEETEEKALGPRRWATVLLNLGTVYRNLGDPHQAVDAYRRAAAIFEREGDRAALSSTRLNLGQVLHANLLRPAEAESALLEALHLARENGDRSVEIQALFLLGELYLDPGGGAGDGKSGRQRAKASFERCLELAVESGSAEGEWWAHYGLGRLAASDDRQDAALDDALRHLMAAIEVLERTRSRVDDRDLRGGFFAGWRHIYEQAVEVLWRRHELAKGEGALSAFSLVQRAKVRELVEAMGGQVAATEAPADLDRLQAALGDAVLVEYFFTSESLFAWRLEAGGLRWWRVKAAGELARSAAAVHTALAAGEAPARREIERLASRLRAAGLDGAGPERLVIAPDGMLRYLPFEILPMTGDLAGGEPLVQRHQVSYLPAASALLHSASGPRDRRRYAFVGLADPAPSRAPGFLSARFALERLPSSRREIQVAAERLTGEHLLLTDQQATLGALQDAMAGGSRVLHLAAHTVIDERPGGGAAVFLAAGDDGTAGLLGPADLARLELHTDLTVLAACRTAVDTSGAGSPAAHEDRGDGSAFGSLTGSFLAAGSGAVLATLWDVGDAATEVFMQQVYYELGRGHDPSRALTVVKRRMSQDPRWQAPHLWSGYVLIGEAPPVVSRWTSFWRRPTTRLGAALLLLLVLAPLATAGIQIVSTALRRRRR